MKRTIPALPLAALAILALVAASTHAATISVLNTDSGLVPDSGGPGPQNLEANPWTISFNAGATADKLIVTLSGELGTGGPASITYNGDSFTQVPGTSSSRNQGVWYLDSPFTGGSANLTIDMTAYSVVNGIGFGVVSISGSAPGVDTGNSATGLSVSLTPTVADSFVVTNYASNGAGAMTVPGGHTELYNGDIGSAHASSGFVNSVPASLQTYAYTDTGGSANVTSGAAFSPIPEPSVSFLGLGGAILLLRRRRHQ